MNWIPALALLLTIAVAENAPTIPRGDGALRMMFVVVGTLLLVLFSRIGVSRLIPKRQVDAESCMELAARIRCFERVRWCLWLTFVGFVVFVVHWPQVVRYDWQLNQLPIVDDLLVLAPVMLSLICVWATSYELHDDGLFQPTGETARVGLKARFGYALRRLRDELALLLIPIATILIAADAGTFAASWTGNENASWIAYAVGFAALIAAFPNMLQSLWRTFELPECSLKSRLSGWAIKLGIQYRGIHVWESGGRMANAAVVGILPRWRYILLTDELIERLTSREVEAVALHEMAHIARRHTLWRTLALFPPLGVWLLVQEFWPGATALARQQYALSDLDFAGSVPLTVGFVVYAIVVLAFISRLFEHDADLVAIGELQRDVSNGSDEIVCGDFASALRKLVSGDRYRARRKSWLHPSINRRLAFLRLVSLREEKSTRFRRQLRAICTLLALCPLTTATILICRALF